MSFPLVLVVDEEPDVRGLMSVVLQASGYRTTEANGGLQAIEKVHSQAPDLVLLDVSLGGHDIDGFEVCRRIRRSSEVPVVFLTGRAEDVDQVIGFSAGADDYLTKPLNSQLLLAHVGAVLRRSQSDGPHLTPVEVNLDGLEIDLESRTLSVKGQPLDLTRIQFDLLVALVEHPRRVLTRQQLVRQVWGEWFTNDHHLDVHLSRLRQRILQAGGPRVGYAVRGVGFRFSE